MDNFIYYSKRIGQTQFVVSKNIDGKYFILDNVNLDHTNSCGFILGNKDGYQNLNDAIYYCSGLRTTGSCGLDLHHCPENVYLRPTVPYKEQILTKEISSHQLVRSYLSIYKILNEKYHIQYTSAIINGTGSCICGIGNENGYFNLEDAIKQFNSYNDGNRNDVNFYTWKWGY